MRQIIVYSKGKTLCVRVRGDSAQLITGIKVIQATVPDRRPELPPEKAEKLNEIAVRFAGFVRRGILGSGVGIFPVKTKAAEFAEEMESEHPQGMLSSVIPHSLI